MSGPSPPAKLPVQSPDSDISPTESTKGKEKVNPEYFPVEEQQEEGKEEEEEQESKSQVPETLSRVTTMSSRASPSLDSTSGSLSTETTKTENNTTSRNRGSSLSGLSFAQVRNPSLPQGIQRATRLRNSSPPPPDRFQTHVAFDNLPLGEATKNNTISLTLNVKHTGYQAQRRSRTFMVGLDENSYSDHALQWLLDELVDDHDEIVCVRVIEKEVRVTEKEVRANDARYKADARRIMDNILQRNGANRAISVVLEYASGKLHSTFQKLIQMHQPAMLVVGTRGRSLAGLQGLVHTRNSFSKYCLQYSVVPVVVVRSNEKREKKKAKRLNDSERQTYVRMLSATGGKHEADSERSSMYEVEVSNTPDEEAHKVAQALGLPASFDPTIKPVDPKSLLQPRGYSLSQTTSAASSKNPGSTAGDSDEDDDDDDDDFEVFTGDQLISPDQKEKLHKMEAGEAAALLKQNRKTSLDSTLNVDDDDEEESKVSQTSSSNS
ncbi:Universal stress protein A family protein [Colletotrichum trifolii]|uniref:Universal stress protein A family protein n=1 Tax=Colletotrichum trifolii TaxID=5466 RepID=A0A4R8QH23_COLTR|nr:Universal stress protein A family protein [Colletotrichum trifolii]